MTRTRLLVFAACVVCGSAILAIVPHRPAPQPSEGTAAAPLPPAPVAEEFPPLARFGDSRLRHPAPVKSLALNTTGTHLLTATRAEPILRLWDVKTGKLVRELAVTEEFTQSMTVIALSPDARFAFVIRHQWRQGVSESHKWHEPATVDLVTGRLTRWPLGRESEDFHPIFALSPDGKTLAGIIRDELRAWDFPGGTPRVLGTIAVGNGQFGNVCFSPDGKFVAATKGSTVFHIAPIDGSARPRAVTAVGGLGAVVWPQPNRVVGVWLYGLCAHDPTTGAVVGQVNFGQDSHLRMPHAAAGELLFVRKNSWRGPAVFDLTKLAPVLDHPFNKTRRDALATSADGRVLAVATGHAVRLFDARSGNPLHPELDREAFEPAARLHVTPDGSRVLGCGRI